MFDINIASFLIFDMLIIGLSITAFHDLKTHSQMHNYWRLSLVLFALGYAAFAAGPFTNRLLLTIGNFCIVAAAISIALLFRSWNTKVSSRLNILLLIAAIFLAIFFEYLRNNGTFQQRVLLIMSALIACEIWQAYELTCRQRTESNFHCKLLIGFSYLKILISFGRLAVISFGTDPANINLYNESLFALISRWGLMVMDVLTYITINGYYTEKSWKNEQLALTSELIALQKNTVLRQEIDNAENLNKELALVLSEKNKLLTSVATSMKANKMGLMASSLAHEINQPLCAIRLNSEFLLAQSNQLADNAFIQENLKYLISDVDRIHVIVTKIKQFFDNDYSDFKEINLLALVHTVTEQIAEQCKASKIAIMLDVNPSLNIRGDQGQLQMVILNLLINAIDVLKTFDDARNIVIKTHESASDTILTVEDSGPGIQANMTENIFALFNTTKSEGMGVGLWLSRAIMENHGGHLILEQNPQCGARFLMQFNKER